MYSKYDFNLFGTKSITQDIVDTCLISDTNYSTLVVIIELSIIIYCELYFQSLKQIKKNPFYYF